jgi:hypothetical protein
MNFLRRLDPIVPGFVFGLLLSVIALFGLHLAASSRNMLSDRMAEDPNVRTGLHFAAAISQAPVERLVLGRSAFLEKMKRIMRQDETVAYVDTLVFDLRTLSAVLPLIMRTQADQIYLEFNPRDWKGQSQIEPPVDIYAINDIALNSVFPFDLANSIEIGYRMLGTLRYVFCYWCSPEYLAPVADNLEREMDIETVRREFFVSHESYFGSASGLASKIIWVSSDEAMPSIGNSSAPFFSGVYDPQIGQLRSFSDITAEVSQ